jgi:hypothetical protein
MTFDRALRAGAIALVVALGGVGLALPGSILAGGLAWLAAITFALSGWGWLVVRAGRLDDADFGLRAVWGIAAVLAASGLLVALGLCTKPALLILVGIGLAAFGWREWVTPEPVWHHARAGGRQLRAHPVAGMCALVLGAAVLVHVIGAVAQLDRNPYDDDIAYTPLVKRLLSTGDLVEPFSFRRLASYGGQTLLQALLGARGSLVSVHTLDRGLCFALVALLSVGHARAARVRSFWLAIVILVLVLTPELAINTASCWSGVACFYALYRTLALTASTRQLAVAALVAAATCTLRMNYIAVVVPYLVVVFVSRARAGSWRDELRRWRLAFAVGAAALLPWCAAAVVSSRTFLYPLVEGTWNHGLELQPVGWSWVDRLAFVAQSCIDTEPIIVMPLLFPLLVLASDRRPGRPLSALVLAATFGFVYLGYSFASSDTWSIWRYAFAYALPAVLGLALDAASDSGPVQLPSLARWVLLAALAVQLAFGRTGVAERHVRIFHDIAAARYDAPETAIQARRYTSMQAVVPPGERLAVLVDEPAYLDFARNRIANLDTPGFASPAPQWPSFEGADAVRAYLLETGVRYLAFVRGDRSRSYYRRELWLKRLFNDNEFFERMSAYLVDAIDTMGALATSSQVLYDQDGLVVLDLEAAHVDAPRLDPDTEQARRGAFVRRLAERESLLPEWGLSSRPEVLFEDGMPGITYEVPADARWTDYVPADAAPVRGAPSRWMRRRTHLRVRGGRDMHLVLRGHVNLKAVFTHPHLEVSLAGEPLGDVVPDHQGAFVLDVVVPREQLGDGWCDLYAIFDSIGDSMRDVYDLKIARLEAVVWEPR